MTAPSVEVAPTGFWPHLGWQLRRRDKLQHIGSSFALMLAGLQLVDLWLAVVAVFLIGLAKEVWDEWFGSGFCGYDILGNCVGMAAALLLWLPLNKVLLP